MPPVALYGSPVKIGVVLILTFLWLYLCTRVNADAIAVHAKRELWSTMVLAAGVVGLLCCLFISVFWIGLPVFIVCLLTVFIVYIFHRNGLVDDELKIFTREWLKEKVASRGKKTRVEKKVRVYDSYGKPVIISDREKEDCDLVAQFNFVQDLFFDILCKRASIVEIRPVSSEEVRPTFVIDGVPEKQNPLSMDRYGRAVEYLKEKGGIDLDATDGAQHGKITVDVAESPQEMRLLVSQTKDGAILRIEVAQEMLKTSLETLGMREDVRNNVIEATKTPGLIIISGPGCSGVTSTVYSILRKQDAFTRVIHSVEHEPGLDLPNITQVEYEDAEGFLQVFATTLRRNPDVL